MKNISVLISNINDPRIHRLIRSLEKQTTQPMEILVETRGTVAGSRNMMIQKAKGDILAFIDTDEEAPSHWLYWLTRPLNIGSADFTCGPTKTHPIPWYKSRYDKYLAITDERLFEMCKKDQTIYPMGNTAWKKEVFEELKFDKQFGGWAGEDYDINLRATNAGFVGKFVPGAWVWHDQSHLNSALKILRRKYRYMVGGALAYLKNQVIIKQVRRIVKQPRYYHWLEAFNPPFRIAAYLKARRMVGR